MTVSSCLGKIVQCTKLFISSSKNSISKRYFNYKSEENIILNVYIIKEKINYLHISIFCLTMKKKYIEVVRSIILFNQPIKKYWISWTRICRRSIKFDGSIIKQMLNNSNPSSIGVRLFYNLNLPFNHFDPSSLLHPLFNIL